MERDYRAEIETKTYFDKYGAIRWKSSDNVVPDEILVKARIPLAVRIVSIKRKNIDLEATLAR